MRIFKTKSFHRWAKCESVSDVMLKKAVNEITQGLIDADLGGGLLKKRVARQGEGKRSGFRILIAYRPTVRLIFLFGYAKNERDNIIQSELILLRDFSRHFLNDSDMEMQVRIKRGELIEVF
ncbi:MAG TPA: type II toxin-antitoxin system RelE/ParE family toxin [Coxiellaceae bacterium]|nr:MAG: hypothetical protein A3E81_00750 [Gammaproteobacteria bacterium RIFCSPHIGHO2_12_FULL_36_30]HLB56688.1 type II toxin-antitoxin system RelE/ParE family toxin [Coxiellaceae bacterium]